MICGDQLCWMLAEKEIKININKQEQYLVDSLSFFGITEAQMLREYGNSKRRFFFRGCYNQKDVFVKIFQVDDTVRGLDNLRTFNTETNALRNLCHPNIVQMYLSGCMDSGDRKFYFIVMEEADGIDASKWPVDDVSRIAKPLATQLLQTMQYIHSCGFLYADLKFANFKVDEIDDNLCVKMYDFDGVVLRNETPTSFRGTLPFADCSLFKNALQYNETVDIWGVGVCIYFLFARRFPCLPNDKSYPSEVIVNALKNWDGKLQHSECMGNMEAIVSNMLSIDPCDRLSVPSLLNLLSLVVN